MWGYILEDGASRVMNVGSELPVVGSVPRMPLSQFSFVAPHPQTTQTTQASLPTQKELGVRFPVTTFSEPDGVLVEGQCRITWLLLSNLNTACANECAGKTAREFDGCLILHQKLQEADTMPLVVGTSILKYSSANAESCSSMSSILSSFWRYLCSGSFGQPCTSRSVCLWHM